MKKISYLDGLRGLAAFEVVFHHFVLAFYPALFSGPDNVTHLKDGFELFASGSFFNLLWDGNFAVCIFFVLSGFVLSHKFFLQKRYEIIAASAVKRYFRLALPVAFSVVVSYLVMKLSFFYNRQAGDISGSVWLSSFWTFTPSFWDSLRQAFFGTFFLDTFQYNAVLWTIACEFLGSFLIFAFLAFFGKDKNRFWVYAFLIIFFSQTYYLAFVLGMLLSDIMAHHQTILGKFDKKKILRTTLLILGLFLASYPSGRNAEETWYGFMNFSWLVEASTFYHVIAAFMLMIVLLDSKKMQKVFSFKYFLFLGEISFMMYLLHFIVLGSFSSFVFLKLAPFMSYSDAAFLSFISSLLFIFGISYLTYKYIDKNSVRFSHFIYAKFFSKKEALQIIKQ